MRVFVDQAAQYRFSPSPFAVDVDHGGADHDLRGVGPAGAEVHQHDFELAVQPEEQIDEAVDRVVVEGELPSAGITGHQRQPARRPYDLRHAAVSLWLNAGVPATEVARRAGHGVAVLLKVYANCIDGQADAANQCIGTALDEHDSE